MSDGQGETMRQIEADAVACPSRNGWAPGNYQCLCIVCGCLFVGDKRATQCKQCAAACHTGPPMAYQATGGADWQSDGGWRYKPLNEAAVAQQMVRLASSLQDTANATAAFGMGRGRYPEWSDEMASLARRMVVWAKQMDTDAADAAETEA